MQAPPPTPARNSCAYSNKVPLLAFRAAEQIRTCLAYSKIGVKLAAHYAGVSDSFDGPTHHAISDVAVMRGLPGMTIVTPADATEARLAVAAVAEYPGPVYLRLNRNELPVIFGPEHRLVIGKGEVLRKGGDVTIVANGVMLARALEAAEQLASESIRARVISMPTIKPMDSELLVAAARETGCLVCAEEHSVIGGLGGAVAEELAECCPVPVIRVGLRDRFAETGPYAALLDRYGLAIVDVVAAARRAVALKRECR